MATLGYWDVRGLAEPIRLLLAYLKIDYTEKYYHFDAQDEWFNKDKPALGVDFPNIPYYIDGEETITQSTAIPIYLLKKNKRFDLLAQNADGSYSEREIRYLEVLGAVNDIRTVLIRVIFNPDFKNLREPTYNTSVLPLVNQIVKYLGKKEFLLDTITYADFVFYDTIILLKYIYPQSFNQTFQDFVKRFESLDGIKEFVATPHIQDEYFFHKIFAKWVGPSSDKQ